MLSTHTIPGVNDINATVLEVCDVAGRELGASGLGDGGDLRIGVADRPAEGTAVTGNPRKSSRCIAVEPENAARQVLGKHSLRRCQQPFAALAFGEQLKSIKDFRLGD
jgi:hypothetical protein